MPSETSELCFGQGIPIEQPDVTIEPTLIIKLVRLPIGNFLTAPAARPTARFQGIRWTRGKNHDSPRTFRTCFYKRTGQPTNRAAACRECDLLPMCFIPI